MFRIIWEILENSVAIPDSTAQIAVFKNQNSNTIYTIER